jgi:hypothetical protein
MLALLHPKLVLGEAQEVVEAGRQQALEAEVVLPSQSRLLNRLGQIAVGVLLQHRCLEDSTGCL